MSFNAEHELHKRRFGRNLGVALVLAGFIAIVFGLTVVKVTNLGPESLQGYDHVTQPSLVPAQGQEGN